MIESAFTKVENLEELSKIIPAYNSIEADPKRSNKYSLVSTIDVVKNLNDLGWNVHSAKQQGSGMYGRHLIKFTNDKLGKMELKGDNITPQIILDNSHNGSSNLQLHMGLFRLVCQNGLVVSNNDETYNNIKLRHMGIDKNTLQEYIETYINKFGIITEQLNEYMDVKMNQYDIEEYTIKAVANREPWLFVNKDNCTIIEENVHRMVDISEICKPIRGEDKANNLWATYNVVQERLTKGGYNRKGINGRKSIAKGISSPIRDLQFNKMMWNLTEETKSKRVSKLLV